MKPAGSFKYQPAFELDKGSAEELLDVDDVNELTDEGEVCHAIIDYRFDDVDAQVLYGEIGSTEETAKFFLRTVLNEDGSPEEIKIFVPDNQDRYPTGEQFWAGFNQPEDADTEERKMVEQVRNIAKNFKTGEIVIIDAASLVEEQLEQEDASDSESSDS